MEDGDLQLLCSGCGADLKYSAGARALKCIYCAAVTEIPRAENEAVDATPDQVVTLTVSRNQLEDAVFQHLADGKYTPDNLLEHATFTKIEQFFVPAYAFTGTYEAQWTASFGYNRTEHYTEYVRDSNGRSQPVNRTRTVTDWRPVNGSDSGKFGILIYGGSRLHDNALALTTRLVEHCQMAGDVADYSPSYTSGFEVEAYSVPLDDAYRERGSALVDEVIDAGVKRHAQGDTQKDWHWTATTRKQSSRVLVPVCHVVYEYQGQSYNVWTDGTSTANLLADPSPQDDSRKRAVRIGFVPTAVGVAAFAGVVASTDGALSALPENPLMWGGLLATLLYGVLRRGAILSYSMKLRQAILAQKKLDTTNTANVDEAERQRMIAACKRPSRSWLAGAMKDAIMVPAVSAVALAAIVAPRLHQAALEHRARPAEIAAARPYANPQTQAAPPADQAPATTGPAPQATPEQTESQTARMVADVPANAARQVSLPQPVNDVLAAAQRGDWGAVDAGADRMRSDRETGAPRDRAIARDANNEGRAALQARDFGAAIEAFRRGAEADPADIEILNNLGYAYGEAGESDDAVETLSEVLMRAPKRSSAWANLSDVLADTGHLSEATAALGTALHYSGNRDRTLAALQKQSNTGRTEAIRQVNLAVAQQAPGIPGATAPAKAATAQSSPQRPPAHAQAPNAGYRDEVSVRDIQQHVNQQLRSMGISR
ncbi:hypothetical protein PTE30175_01475 [Pandoraea terrae]|uniref:Uncharacterized protein n=1 Tax=Pandoraea terrae TaxID=1537710 RepID=A0A5E4TPM1_9BURK|nr:tetratricopeptide repeat protein [Pandoraea terrae]VVD89521.1 hypothetical protein PTE30175_01475 [Pandoraea terrae]